MSDQTQDPAEQAGAGVEPPEPDQGDIAGQDNSPTPPEGVGVDTGRSKEELEADAGQPLGDDEDVTRTSGPGAEATLDANVGQGEPNPPTIPDAALGQHAKYENQAIPDDDPFVGGGKVAQDKAAAAEREAAASKSTAKSTAKSSS